jgi:hypothetical protein
MENAGIFYGHLEYFTVIWYILHPFVNVVIIWYIFPCFGTLCQEKSGVPMLQDLGSFRSQDFIMGLSSSMKVAQKGRFIHRSGEISGR